MVPLLCDPPSLPLSIPSFLAEFFLMSINIRIRTASICWVPAVFGNWVCYIDYMDFLFTAIISNM